MKTAARIHGPFDVRARVFGALGRSVRRRRRRPTARGRAHSIGLSATLFDFVRMRWPSTRNLNAVVIDVVATASNPVAAAVFANAVVDEYLVAQERTKREAADRALAWMRERDRRPARAHRRAEPRHQGPAARDAGRRGRRSRHPANQLREVGNSAGGRPHRAGRGRFAAEPAARRLAASDVTAAGEVIDTPELAGVRRQLADLRQRLAAERASRGETRPVAAAELQAQIASLTEDARGLVAQA